MNWQGLQVLWIFHLGKRLSIGILHLLHTFPHRRYLPIKRASTLLLAKRKDRDTKDYLIRPESRAHLLQAWHGRKNDRNEIFPWEGLL